MAQQIESEFDCDWPEGKGLGVCRDLIPGAYVRGMSPAVGARVDARFGVGLEQHGRGAKDYLVTGEPKYDFRTYLEKAGRHVKASLDAFENPDEPGLCDEDHLAAAACDLILAMQHEARKTDRPEPSKPAPEKHDCKPEGKT